MTRSSPDPTHIVTAFGEKPIFKPGDPIRIADRSPIGHYRVPRYLRRKLGRINAVIEPAFIDNKEEGFGRSQVIASNHSFYKISRSMNSADA
ncbi:SH3-like domain-containing protein [Hyphomicrobium sp. ghe19]|uniref:SH3-like domain-containing protein n=1 Tax=Hyphomicrobium sp. ghe19 TaxID=2682968 RepID=UPI0013675AD7|nr:hypothetical protein HYPP_01244 [Hyphomicrobium sp. ghe19]